MKPLTTNASDTCVPPAPCDRAVGGTMSTAQTCLLGAWSTDAVSELHKDPSSGQRKKLGEPHTCSHSSIVVSHAETREVSVSKGKNQGVLASESLRRGGGGRTGGNNAAINYTPTDFFFQKKMFFGPKTPRLPSHELKRRYISKRSQHRGACG